MLNTAPCTCQKKIRYRTLAEASQQVERWIAMGRQPEAQWPYWCDSGIRGRHAHLTKQPEEAQAVPEGGRQ